MTLIVPQFLQNRITNSFDGALSSHSIKINCWLTPRGSLISVFWIIYDKMVEIHSTWFAVWTMVSWIILVCWSMTVTHPGSSHTQNSRLQYQLSLINKTYSCMVRNLVILNISYPKQISLQMLSSFPSHKDITFICFDVFPLPSPVEMLFS